MGIYLALDIGKRKTGIAKSDSMGIIVRPLKTILSENLLEEIQSLDLEFGIEMLVIGEPTNIAGGNDDAMKMVQAKIQLIDRNFPKLEMALIDERFTSKEAETVIKQKGISVNKDNKELIDQYAAAIILETYWKMTNGGDYLSE